jgi:hypothetical protein
VHFQGAGIREQPERAKLPNVAGTLPELNPASQTKYHLLTQKSITTTTGCGCVKEMGITP